MVVGPSVDRLHAPGRPAAPPASGPADAPPAASRVAASIGPPARPEHAVALLARCADVVDLEALAPDDLALWDSLTAGPTLLDSPYFTVAFARLVHRHRRVVVARLVAEGRTVGLVPFHRRGHHGEPLGSVLSDFHGVVAPAHVAFDAHDVLRVARIRSLRFGHLVPHPSLAPYVDAVHGSPYVDLRDGFDAFVRERERSGAEMLGKLARLERRAARATGGVRVVHGVRDREVLRTCLRWKAAQAEADGYRHAFGQDWVAAVLADLICTDEPPLAGLLSALWLGDELAAVHLGMRSATTFHYWLPAYDRAHARWSPGSLLLVHLLREAADRGLAVFDLGRGDNAYKRRLTARSRTVWEGRVERSVLSPEVHRAGRTTALALRRAVRDSPAGPAAHAALRSARAVRTQVLARTTAARNGR